VAFVFILQFNMAEEGKKLFVRALPALFGVPPDEASFLRLLIQVIFTIIRPPPDQLMLLRYRIRNHDIYYWDGRDVYSMCSANRYSFFETTGDTPETLLDITTQLQNEMFQAKGRPHRISPRNRVMFFYVVASFLSILPPSVFVI
jgi:hypothetical protein